MSGKTETKETFAKLMDSFQYRQDSRKVFDDFLTIAICAFSQIPGQGKSRYEDLYMLTIKSYSDDDIREKFPKLLACLILEMEAGVDGVGGCDVLGNYYEQNISRGKLGQYFTPWSICQFMAQITSGDTAESEQDEEPKRFIDPACGSGRMLLAGAKHNGPHHRFYGIEVDHTCVRMAAINMFLNGLSSEIMCANALDPQSFVVSYRTSLLPLGIFKIEQKEQSPLWNMNKSSFENGHKPKPEFRDSGITVDGPQLKLF